MSGLTRRQIDLRRTGITATDIRVLAGVDPYGRTEHDVWRSKALGEDDFRETEATEIGQELEPIVIPRLARKIGLYPLRIQPEKLTVTHPKFPHHIATPDAIFAETAVHLPVAAGQVKVCGLHQAGAWGSPEDGADAIPDYVLVQCAWEMHVTMLPTEYVGALIGTEIRPYAVRLTPDMQQLIEQLKEIADRFHTDYVLSKKPPPVDGSPGARRMLASLYPRNRGTMIRASAEVEGLAVEYFQAKRDRDAADGRMELSAQEIMESIGESDGVEGDGWRAILKWRDEVPVAYTRKGYRHFDMRAVQGNRRRTG